MLLEKVSLFSQKRDFFTFLFLSLFILSYSLLMEYQNYKNLNRFDSHVIMATVLNQYTKTKDNKTYQVLKLKSDEGYTFYTGAKESQPDIKGLHVKLEIWSYEKSFYEYLTGFYAYSRILHVNEDIPLKHQLNSFISSQHVNEDISKIYQALFSASSMTKELYATFSTLGVSHLFAISGFHLGVLSGVLFFMLKYPYTFLQNRYFPYRSQKFDMFIIISFVLLAYLLFLDSPASLLRAFAMLVIGFFLYDRGMKIVSMQTLFLTAGILLSLFPKLFFTLGFWLSVCGVFYIFLFLIHFKNLSKIWQFILVPFWIYIFMLPYSLAIFGSFSIYHPLSIIWTSLFTIFYPVSIFLHVIGFGSLFDRVLESFIELGRTDIKTPLELKWLFLHVILSFVSIWKKPFLWIVLIFALFIFANSFLQLVL